MNNVQLSGRLTRDPEVRYTQGENPTAIARFTLAVNREGSNTEQTADFIPCVAFGKRGEFAEKYLRQGTKIIVSAGRIQTGSYTNKDGVKVYTTDVVVNGMEFAESKKSGSAAETSQPSAPLSSPTDDNGFMSIPDGMEDELPFK